MPTTTVKSIGTSSRDYSTIQAWEDACPANLVTNDEIWKGELYNDAEFYSSTGSIVTFSGITTDATRYPWLTAASGQSFQDHANVRTNPLTYDQSKGVGLRTETSYSGACVTSSGVSYIHIDRLQFHSHRWSIWHSSAAGGTYKDCISYNTYADTVHISYMAGGELYNFAMFSTGAGTYSSGAVATIYHTKVVGCTLVRSSDRSAHGIGFRSDGGTSSIRSCAAFGFLTPITSAFATKSYNATDQSSIEGTDSQTSVTFSATTPFVQADKDSTVDLRAVASTALAAAGYKDATNAPNDITGTARAASPTIGAWELVAAGGATTFVPRIILM